MSKTYLNPSALFPSQQYGFSQGVATVGKTTVYVSGQVGWHAAQQITDPADLGTQTRQALENLEIAVRAAGGTRTDIVSLRLYAWANTSTTPPYRCAKHYSASSHQTICRAAPGSGFPPWPAKIFLIEIEAVAVLE